MSTIRAREPGWADVLEDHAAEWSTARRLVGQLGAGVAACPTRIAQSYLELAVLVRALQGLADMARIDAAPDRSSLWAGLFDLRENLERAAGDLRALAA